MAKRKKVKLRKDDSKRERLVDIEIDEISLVDKPAIEDEFIITKMVKRGKSVGKKNTLIKTAREIQKGVFWKRAFKKDKEGCTHGEHCVLCGISKANEEETIGMGLRNSVCFKCAVLHMEKGVLEDCLSGKFDLDKFKKDNTEVEIHTKAKDDESSEDAGNKASKKKEDEKEKEDEEDEDEEEDEEEEDDDEDEDEEDNEDEDKKKKEEAAKIAAKSKKNKKTLAKRVINLEKNLEDVVGMLEGAAEFQEQVLVMFNQQSELLVGALEMVMMISMGEDQEVAAEQAAKSLKIKLKSFRRTVQKAGAKISAGRLQTLRDIADKLTTLIQSVLGEQGEKEGGKNGKKSKKTKSQDSIESLTELVSDLKKSIEQKDKALADRLDDLEAFGGASSEIDEDEEDESSEESQGSVFKGFGPLKDVSSRIQKHTRAPMVKSKA